MVSIRLEESPAIAHRSISSFDIAYRPVHLREAIELAIAFVPHLAYTVMRSIASINTPVTLLSYQLMKALILLIIDKP